MRGDSRIVLLLSLLLLLVNPCVLERAERENSLDLHERNDEGADVNQDIQAENQQTLIKHDKEDGSDSIDPKKEAQFRYSQVWDNIFISIAKFLWSTM